MPSLLFEDGERYIELDHIKYLDVDKLSYITFRYEPLQNISSDLRLIEIIPGGREDDLKCRMCTYRLAQSLEQYPRYEALSYAWGDDTNKLPILVDSGNGGGDKVFQVTRNLYSALLNLRKCRIGQSIDQRILIWIDALCIDQQNLDERSGQVQRMTSIYQRAEKVVIYLGDYEELADRRLQFAPDLWGIDGLEHGSYPLTLAAFTITMHLSSLVRIANEEEATQMLTESSRRDRPSNALADICGWAHLSRLFNRPWFDRLWIIQELDVSKEALVLCGGIAVPWSTIEDAAAFILRPHHATPPEIRRFFPLMGAHRVTQVTLNAVSDVDKSNILTILRHTQGASCSDPRDKLYAIRGVSEDIKDIDIDYSKPFDVAYRDWAIKRIIRKNSLDVLSACTNSSRSGELPSWVPDLRRPWAQDKTLWRHTHQHPSFIRGSLPPNLGTWNKENLFTGFDLQLVSDGSFIGKISSLSEICDAVTNLSDPTNLTNRLCDTVKTLEAWYLDWRMQIQPHFSEESDIVYIIRTALLRTSRTYEPHYLFWLTYRENGINPRWTQQHVDACKNFEAILFSLVHGSQLLGCCAKDFKVGTIAGNCSSQVGDEIWILRGGLTPFILRRHPSGHHLIGPCFLDGYMETSDPSLSPLNRYLDRHLSSTKLEKVVLT